MARSKITQAKLADILDVTPTTMSFKLSGRSSLSLRECVEIKRKAFPDKTLDYLFATEVSRKMADRVSIVAVSIAAFLTAINQISIIITAKQLWMQQQQLQQQLERLQKERSEL